MKKILSFLFALSLAFALGGQITASAENYASRSINWTDMNVTIKTEIPETWTVERRQQGYMNGLSYYSPSRETLISYCCAWPNDYYDENNELISKDSYDFIDCVIKEAVSNMIGEINHNEIAGLRAGYAVYWDRQSDLAWLLYVIPFDEVVLLVQITDGYGNWSSTMDVVNHSLDTLLISKIDE